MENVRAQTKKIAYLGLMLAAIIVLGIFEHTLPPLPFLPPNAKLGLSNVITMYCFFFIGKKEATFLLCLKSFFVFITRGFMSAALSICGGMLSILSIILIKYLTKNRASYVILSISGAIFHNIGQIFAICVLLKYTAFIYYLPVMIISGTILGTITGKLLETVLPVLNKTLNNDH